MLFHYWGVEMFASPGAEYLAAAARDPNPSLNYPDANRYSYERGLFTRYLWPANFNLSDVRAMGWKTTHGGAAQEGVGSHWRGTIYKPSGWC